MKPIETTMAVLTRLCRPAAEVQAEATYQRGYDDWYAGRDPERTTGDYWRGYCDSARTGRDEAIEAEEHTEAVRDLIESEEIDR